MKEEKAGRKANVRVVHAFYSFSWTMTMNRLGPRDRTLRMSLVGTPWLSQGLRP